MTHPLLAFFHDAAGGRFPPVDGETTYLPPLVDGFEAVVAFTGHAIIASRLGRDVLAPLEPDGFGGALAPAVLTRMAGTGTIGVIDVTLVRHGVGGGSLPETDTHDDHPRVRHARKLRRDVRVFGDRCGFVTLARGLAGRAEMSVELVIDPPRDGPRSEARRTGRDLITEALGLVPAGTPLFAAVSPGNARSLRAFLACGFVPLGSEVLVHPGLDAAFR